MTRSASEARTFRRSKSLSWNTKSSANTNSILEVPSEYFSQQRLTSGRSRITRHSDSSRGDRHFADTRVWHCLSVAANVQTRGLNSNRISGSVSATAGACNAKARPVRTHAASKLQAILKGVNRADERCRNVTLRND